MPSRTLGAMDPFATTPPLEPTAIEAPAPFIAPSIEPAAGADAPRLRRPKKFAGLVAIAAVFLAAAGTFGGLWFDARGDVDHLGDELADRNVEIADRKVEIADLQSKLADLGRQLDETEGALAGTSAQLLAAQAHAEQLQRELDTAGAELAKKETALQNALDDAAFQQHRADEAERQRDDQKRRADEAEAALAEVKTSWVEAMATSAFSVSPRVPRDQWVCFYGSTVDDLGLAQAIGWFNSPDDGTPPPPDVLRAVRRALVGCDIDPADVVAA